jgi:phosphoribosylglycinamide formyltransferase 1
MLALVVTIQWIFQVWRKNKELILMNIGVLVSGGGTNLQSILDKIKSGYLCNCDIKIVVASRPGIYAISRAEQYGIPTACVSKKNFSTLELYDEALLDVMKSAEVELVVMAGFLSLVGEKFVAAYKNRIINIHPSLIPSFCGTGYFGIVPHRMALEYGVKVTGATVHFVDKCYDSGPIILQKAVEVRNDDTPESLQLRVMEEAEWEILPNAIKLYIDGKLQIDGRKVKIN